MTKKRSIYVVGGADHYINWCKASVAKNMEEATVVLFSGGEDVSPHLYDAKANVYTSNNVHRDLKEIEAFKKARKLNKPLLGICRGAQFLCVMAGGKLVQDQSNPRFTHCLMTSEGETIHTTSTHHQAQYPWGLDKKDYKVLAWSKYPQSSFHHGEDSSDEMVIGKVEDDKEVEVCYYPKINALAWQGHPEQMVGYQETYPDAVKSIEYTRSLLDKLIKGEL